MKIILLALFSFCCIITCNSRLIEKITDRTLTTETKTGSNAPVRLTRDAEISHEEDATGIAEAENNSPRNEDLQFYDKKVKQFFETSDDSELTRFIRMPRDSSERIERAVKNITSSSSNSPAAHVRPKVALVKKPIPKYNEMDYDDDFQMKMNKSPMRILDSGEHEDEDFSLNDYEFDVNHDEFIGRGKPLEPRIKHKQSQVHSVPVKQDVKPAVAPEIKIKSKVNIPSLHKSSHKRGRSAEINKKPGEKEDYYDETTTTKTSEKARDLEDDFNEENEESKEYDNKGAAIRLIRSPWKNSVAAKFGEKSSILSILPMFPQMPSKRRVMANDIESIQTSATNTQLED